MKYRSFVQTPELHQLPEVDFLSPEMRENSIGMLRELRQRGPLCYVKPFGALGILPFEEVDSVLRDFKNFSSDFQILPYLEGAEGVSFLTSLVRQDPPVHTRGRALTKPAMSTERLSFLAGLMRRIVRELVGKVLERGDTFDFVEDFGEPLPVIALASLLGVGNDPAQFKRWCDALANRASVHYLPQGSERDRRLAEITASYREMDDFIRDAIARRRREPADDLITSLVEENEEGDALSEDEIVALVQLILMAGIETTARYLGLAMNLLVHNPEQIDLIAKSPEAAADVVEETLRLEGPLVSVMRVSINEVTIRGFKIPKGMLIAAVIASANTDETVFTNPEVFDPNRAVRKHLAFGSGIHACIGAIIARAMSRILFEELALSMERIQPAGPAVRSAGVIRGFDKMPLRFVRRGSQCL